MRQQEYASIVATHEDILKKLTATSNSIGFIKLFGILLLGVSIYFLISRSFPLSLIVAGTVILVSLTILWVYHRQLHEKINYSRNIIAINKRHLDRISGEWTAFPDIGAEFVDLQHPYASDLDIVGQKSFFQFIYTTHTWHGRRAFAKDLLQPGFSKGGNRPSEIIARQEAIQELSLDIDFANNQEHNFSKIGIHKSMEKLISGLTNCQTFISNKMLKASLVYVPMVTFVFVAAVAIFRLDNLYPIAISVLSAQSLIWGIGMGKTQNYLNGIIGLPYKLAAYSQVIQTLSNKEFTSDKLRQIQQKLTQPSAAQAIKELDKLAARVNLRHNVIMWAVANILLLWDYETAIKYEDWKIKYAQYAEDWFHALGEFESLLSFSHLPNICSNTCLPIIITDKNIIAEDLGHPLINNDTRVNNNITCQDNIFIISGSNMSGKTTFMRTVGINLVLARAGSYVCAADMSFHCLEIMTSMRIADDLNKGISTFYAELTRIKGIIALAEKSPNMIFLIDEIFRGTNSVDRLSGAAAVLARLNAIGAIGIITTHDLELCEIANNHPRIKNHSFSEEYHDNKIHFDYKLKPGKSTTTNAKYLMEMVGIATHG